MRPLPACGRLLPHEVSRQVQRPPAPNLRGCRQLRPRPRPPTPPDCLQTMRFVFYQLLCGTETAKHGRGGERRAGVSPRAPHHATSHAALTGAPSRGAGAPPSGVLAVSRSCFPIGRRCTPPKLCDASNDDQSAASPSAGTWSLSRSSSFAPTWGADKHDRRGIK